MTDVVCDEIKTMHGRVPVNPDKRTVHGKAPGTRAPLPGRKTTTDILRSTGLAVGKQEGTGNLYAFFHCDGHTYIHGIPSRVTQLTVAPYRTNIPLEEHNRTVLGLCTGGYCRGQRPPGSVP